MSDFEPFLARVRQRLSAGATTYGDASFARPATELVGEIQDELADVAGWAAVLWVRLQRLQEPTLRPDDALEGEEDGA